MDQIEHPDIQRLSLGKLCKTVLICTVHFSFETFVSRYHFPSRNIAADVWEILCSSLDRDCLTSADVHVVSSSVDEESEELSFSESEFQEAQVSSDMD